MTTFAEMRGLVNDITKRPELVSTTDFAIKLATLRAHNVEFFHRDQAIAVLTFTPVNGALFQDIPNVYSTLPLLRIPNFLQSEDPGTFAPTENLEFVPDYKNFYTPENEIRWSVFSLIGETLRMRAQSVTGRASLYYYKNPNTTTTGYASWIADQYPDDLAQWAAAIVWNRSDNLEQAKRTLDLHVNPFKELLVSSHFTVKV